MKYCSKCGKEITDCTVICPECGYSQTNIGLQNQKVKKIIKILSVVSIICFFMPFVTESTFGFEFSLNGFEAAFGTPLNSTVADMFSSSDLRMNMFVFFSIISCIIAMISAFQKENATKSILGYNIVSVILLFLYIITYNLYYEYSDWNVLISIKYGFAIWTLIILNIVIAILACLILCNNKDADIK